MKHLIYILLVLPFVLFAQEEPINDPVPPEPVKELQFFGFFINQFVSSNYFPSNDLLKGQIVGRLFSANTTTTGKQTFYAEQRFLPFFIYQPKLLNGKALVRAAFEIDWTWGDVNYGAGGNFGSAFSGDQVNIQTQNVELEFLPYKGVAINVGLQRLFDTPYNPYRTFATTMMTTGYRLAFWGSDAVGISARFDRDFYRLKGGYYQLYENNVEQDDDVALWELMFEADITPTWRQGLSAWYVWDRANGEGGVSILGQGFNTLLNEYNGTVRFDLQGRPYKADVVWLGTWGNYNAEFNLGRWSLNGFLVSNLGQVTAVDTNTSKYVKAADILGFTANVRGGYRYGQTNEDIVTADVMFTSGDDNNISDKKYSGVLTGNMWGSPGSIFINSGSMILYGQGNVVNRFVSAISDISNMGLGHIGGTINFHKAFIPNKFIGKVGLAAAMSNVAPAGGDKFMGTEVNFKLTYKPAVFMDLELNAAYMKLGDFYKSSAVNGGITGKPDDPLTISVVYKWLMF